MTRPGPEVRLPGRRRCRHLPQEGQRLEVEHRDATRSGPSAAQGELEVAAFGRERTASRWPAAGHSVPVLVKMFERRLRGYRAIGYARDEVPLGLREIEGEVVVEYDEEALRDLEEQDP